MSAVHELISCALLLCVGAATFSLAALRRRRLAEVPDRSCPTRDDRHDAGGDLTTGRVHRRGRRPSAPRRTPRSREFVADGEGFTRRRRASPTSAPALLDDLEALGPPPRTTGDPRRSSSPPSSDQVDAGEKIGARRRARRGHRRPSRPSSTTAEARGLDRRRGLRLRRVRLDDAAGGDTGAAADGATPTRRRRRPGRRPCPPAPRPRPRRGAGARPGGDTGAAARLRRRRHRRLGGVGP